jgi:SAM-dependent methyltransferase
MASHPQVDPAVSSPTSPGRATYVQYGCGPGDVPRSWLNFDASPTLRLQKISLAKHLMRNSVRFSSDVRYGNIVKGLPIESATVDGVYCSHVLEHLARDDMMVALSNTLRILRPGAPFRLVVPDMESMVRRYLDDQLDADELVTELGMGLKSGGFKRKIRSILGNSRHNWMWDERSLSEALRTAGFAGVRRAERGDSGDHLYSEVESPSRWDGCLGMHCVCPG